MDQLYLDKNYGGIFIICAGLRRKDASADGDITTIERVCDVLDAAHAYTPAQRHQQQTDYMRWIQRNRGIRTES